MDSNATVEVLLRRAHLDLLTAVVEAVPKLLRYEEVRRLNGCLASLRGLGGSDIDEGSLVGRAGERAPELAEVVPACGTGGYEVLSYTKVVS